MGEVAEDMLDGSCCSECGQYFKHPDNDHIYIHGYPVLCKDCYTKESELPCAEVDTF